MLTAASRAFGIDSSVEFLETYRLVSTQAGAAARDREQFAVAIAANRAARRATPTAKARLSRSNEG